MGYKTKIDWCDATWNPVTGCLHGCEYCYARRIAERFGEHLTDRKCKNIHYLEKPLLKRRLPGQSSIVSPYPHDFEPTFHRYKLDEPQKWKKPRNIFVCSMADLFGNWVPDEWIDAVIKSTQRALHHRYLFLTKNPKRYTDWLERFEEGHIEGLGEIANCWFGASASTNEELERANRSKALWLSVEPIRERIVTDEDQFMGFEPYTSGERKRWEWVVIGAETGNSKSKIIPQKEWIQEIADVCREYGTPIFMKESLRELMGDDFRQEFPWEV